MSHILDLSLHNNPALLLMLYLFQFDLTSTYEPSSHSWGVYVIRVLFIAKTWDGCIRPRATLSKSHRLVEAQAHVVNIECRGIDSRKLH
jgi:hypothetical protein